MTAHRSVACGVHDPLLACSRIRSEESRRRQGDARFTVQVSVTSRFARIRTEELEAEADRKARSPVGSTLRPEGLILRRATVPDRVPLVSRVVSTPAPRDLFCLCGPRRLTEVAPYFSSLNARALFLFIRHRAHCTHAFELCTRFPRNISPSSMDHPLFKRPVMYGFRYRLPLDGAAVLRFS